MTILLDSITLGDCRYVLSDVPKESVDLVVTDPPYSFASVNGGGKFGNSNRTYHSQLSPMSMGIDNDVLEQIVSKMRKVNCYIWCNKEQVRQLLDFFEEIGCKSDIISWHKTNPTPTCNNKYLSDTEYCLFFREQGVRVYGSYETKRKWYVTPTNISDKKALGHPTVKPLDIIRNLIVNSLEPGSEGTIMDPFLGSGTTAVAAKQLGHHYIGIEKDPCYFETAVDRIFSTSNRSKRIQSPTLGDFSNPLEGFI